MMRPVRIPMGLIIAYGIFPPAAWKTGDLGGVFFLRVFGNLLSNLYRSQIHSICAYLW